MNALVVPVFACVYLGMALGRWPGLMLDRTGIALVGAIVLVLAGALTGDEVRHARCGAPITVLSLAAAAAWLAFAPP